MPTGNSIADYKPQGKRQVQPWADAMPDEVGIPYTLKRDAYQVCDLNKQKRHSGGSRLNQGFCPAGNIPLHAAGKRAFRRLS